MSPEDQKEQFSVAYVRAVVSVAGYGVFESKTDDDSVDMAIAQKGGSGNIRSPRLEIQLKCTSQEIERGNHFSFPLKIKNYNDLRHVDLMVPRILVVVLVPENIGEWLEQTEERMVMRRCGYWMSLRGSTATGNAAGVTVNLPSSQVFSVEGLQSIMLRISQGDLP